MVSRRNLCRDSLVAAVEQWTAREDLKHRLWTLRASIERYLALQQAQIVSIAAMAPGWPGFTEEQQRLNSQKDAAIDTLLNAANNLARALRSKHLPAALRSQGPASLAEPIRHVRNLREHWDENRDFWAKSLPVPSDRKYDSARWYKEQFPDKTPWSAGWSNVDGSVIGGIVSVDELLRRLEELEKAFDYELGRTGR